MIAMTGPTIISEQQQEKLHIVFFWEGGGMFRVSLPRVLVLFLFIYLLVVFVVKWLPLCIPCWFEILLVLIVLVFKL
jgi:hypothetical protein